MLFADVAKISSSSKETEENGMNRCAEARDVFAQFANLEGERWNVRQVKSSRSLYRSALSPSTAALALSMPLFRLPMSTARLQHAR